MTRLPDTDNPRPLYTIGHSNHPLERFMGLLRMHDIQTLADVRSTPYSRFNPQFNRPRLEKALTENGMRYVFLGDQLGARSKDPTHYEDGRVSYRKLAGSAPFQQGLADLLAQTRQQRVTIMCAEREPLDCHRTILVAREIERAGIPILHILGDGALEEHGAAMQRLIKKLKIPQDDLFDAAGNAVELAYAKQAQHMGYKKPQGNP